jgi:BirA family biotin operon repressor/biotin-[acetyl-CoA-carboxylase] ligase
MIEAIDKSNLANALTTQWLGRRFHLFETIVSTNSELSQLASGGEPQGTMVIAEYQSSGKGRLGRKWEAPANTSLLFSLLFRPQWPVEQAQWLMMIAGLAAIDAIRYVTGIEVRLKWPNDIVRGATSPWRKCGGILLEGDIQDSVLRSAVVGVGINVNIAPAQLPKTAINATSIQAESGRTIDRTDLLVSFLEIMERRYEEVSAGNEPSAEWRSALINIDRTVRAEYVAAGGSLEGIAIDTDSLGRLLVRDSSGIIHKLAAGDVTILS